MEVAKFSWLDHTPGSALPVSLARKTPARKPPWIVAHATSPSIAPSSSS